MSDIAPGHYRLEVAGCPIAWVVVISYDNGTSAVWGLSFYEGVWGYRTLGIDPNVWLKRYPEGRLVPDHDRVARPDGLVSLAAAGTKHDADKPRYDLLPPAAIDALVRVLTFGAAKYAPDNWRKVDGWRWRYHAAALRHIFAWGPGREGRRRIRPASPGARDVLPCVYY